MQEDISVPKPDPEGFLIAMEYYNAKPSQCVIYEDSDVGIEAPNKTGASGMVVEKF